MQILRNVAVIDGPLAEEMGAATDGATSVGDNVVVFSFGDSEADTYLHLRRGMEPDDVAEGLEVAAQTIREAAE